MRTLRRAWAVSAAFCALSLAGALLLPHFSGSERPSRVLDRLRDKAATIREDFNALRSEAQRQKKALSEAYRSRPGEELFQVFRGLGLSEETSGAAFHLKNGRLETWWGKVLDLEPFLLSEGTPGAPVKNGASFIIKDKASVFLVTGLELGEGRAFLFRLLSFRPQFRSPYLADYRFLRKSAARNADIDYWDFQEDLAGFERIFTRHQDEYLGHPRETGVVSSLIFPLRLDDGRIAATVTLSPPHPDSARTLLREKALWILSLSLLLFGLLSLAVLTRSAGRFLSSPPARIAAFTGILAVLRTAFLFLSREGAFQSLSAFSPLAFASHSLGGLTRSPADLLLTSLFLFAATGYAVLVVWNRWPVRPRRPVAPKTALLLFMGAGMSALGGLYLFHHVVLRQVVFHGNLNLLRFSFSGAFLLMHLSLLALTLTVLLVLGLPVLKAARATRRTPLRSEVPSPARRGPGRALFLAAGAAALILVVSLNIHTARRDRDLVQETLKNTVLSQEDWASFFLEESLETIDRNQALVMEALRSGGDSQAARRLWERTVIARFNWYSSLEILDDREETVSRFALNVPRSFRPSPGLPQSREWAVTPMSVAFVGREKEFLVGHRDWQEAGLRLGRTVLAVSLDFDLLPFLYSANPYFELLRTQTLSYMEQVDLGFVVYDEEGKILFNPGHLTSGPPPALLPDLLSSPEGRWVRWEDRGRSLSAFCFPWRDRLVGLCLTGKTAVGLASEFLKLFFLYGLFLAVPALTASLLFRRSAIRSFFKSFSHRVYTSLLIIAVVPLLLLTFFTRSYFAGVFARQFTRAAESDAAFARNVLQDFLYLQREEKTVVLPPPEDLVLWISAAVGNDVNLYQNGRLVSSSRREFFEAGVLPSLLDGELRHLFRTELRPFLTQRRRIGGFSFSTLTIPFAMGDAELHISLPFPFERQELAEATAGLVDFLILASVFFALAVAGVARSLGAAIVTPIRKLLDGTREVSLGNLEVSLEHKPDDEMQTLFQGFNTMILSLRQHRRDLAEMSQKAAWAEIARKVAHEVKNPLTPIQLSAEHLLRVYEDRRSDFGSALKQSVSYITSEVENLRKIAQEFLEVSRDAALV
ncbi:MAG: HAMP domain-containing protein, partial [Candidatus Aminicenantes bacterium]|nr:HAMP domain-containing protein [Candidatus Aminicenantes bacterium]